MRINLLLIFLLLPSICYAQIKETSLDVSKIDSTKILTTSEAVAVKATLAGKIMPLHEVTKNDYVSEYKRGTVKYNHKVNNYAFQTVTIPDGEVIEYKNLAQKEPFTQSIYGKNLTFKNCNLMNVLIDDTWVLEGSMNAQIKETIIFDKDKEFKIRELYTNGKYEEIEREEIISVIDDFTVIK